MKLIVKSPIILLVFLYTILLFSFPSLVTADRAIQKTISTPRYILHLGENFPSSRSLNSTTTVKDLTRESILILDKTYEELRKIFKHSPKNRLVVRFLSPTEFTKLTGAPSWTSAMFFHGEVTIPISTNEKINLTELTRTIKHEYTHAVVAELSNYNCPAWLDEGLAQIIEGDPNPLLGPALRKWIYKNKAMNLMSLEDGFTSLDSKIVPAAYAESLFATKLLIKNHGMESIIEYIKTLKKGKSSKDAFKIVYKKDLNKFERELTREIKKWAKSKQIHP